MSRLLWMMLRWLSLPLLALLLKAEAAELWHALRLQGLGIGSLWHPRGLAFMAGILARVLISAGFRRFGKEDPWEFIDTLEHELTHALMGYLTFSPPVSLSASLKSGGEVQLKGSNPLAALAPYYLPLWCLVVTLIGLVARAGMQSAWNEIWFFLFGCFCYRLFREYRWRQTDLHVYGFPFSTLSVAVLLLFNVALMLQLRGLLSGHWFASVWPHARHSLATAWGMLDRLWNSPSSDPG